MAATGLFGFPDFRADVAQKKEWVQWCARKGKIILIRNKLETMPRNQTQYEDRTSKNINKGEVTIYDLGWMILEAIPDMEHRQPIGEQNLDS